ncbi:kinase-like domain-containing protein [Syncephalis fuscata]|nr:kinase-like domain-containing protein [Syncephalis fuscata]
MAYIHNNKITHGSIRLDSILVSQETATNLPHVIFINFELSQQALQKGRAQKNDIIYNSPESFFSELKYDLGKHDIWALGIVFYKLLTGHFPFVYNHETEQSINLTDEDRETTMICMHEDNESIDLFSPPYQNAIVIDNTRVMNIASTILVCNPAKRPSARRLQSYTPALKMDARQ